MSTIFCPRCQKKVVVASTCSDYVHDCDSGDTVLDQEDVFIVGSWEDYTGSGTVLNVMNQGQENQSQGDRNWIEDGEKTENYTERGNNADTHRQRQHQEFIDVTKWKR